MAFFKHAGRPDNCCEECTPEVCDPCGSVCSEATDLNIVIAGVTPCAGYTFTGFPGTYVVSSVGVNEWYQGTDVGTYDVDGDPVGALQIVVTCVDGVYEVTVDAIATGDVFRGSGLLGAAIANGNVCGLFGAIGEGGTATLTE